MYTDSTGTLVSGNFYLQEMTMYTDSNGTPVCGNFISYVPVLFCVHIVGYQDHANQQQLESTKTNKYLVVGDDYVYRFHWYSSMW